jgi:ribosome-binding protein aMBF1 (putative translation factor)
VSGIVASQPRRPGDLSGNTFKRQYEGSREYQTPEQQAAAALEMVKEHQPVIESLLSIANTQRERQDWTDECLDESIDVQEDLIKRVEALEKKSADKGETI